MPDPTPETVGFVGVGQIGAPIAEHLIDWPGGLVVADARPTATAPFAERGATAVATAAEVAARATVVSVMVRDDRQVEEVVAGEDGILATARPGSIVAIHSTVEAATPVRLAEVAADRGVELVDAPVSGGVGGARSGSLAVMVGGSDEAVERLRAPFEQFATLVVRVGGVGTGTRAKLARNLISFAAMAAVGEAARLAEAGGVDLVRLGEVVRHSDRVIGGPGMIMLRPTAGPLATDDGLRTVFGHSLELGTKDLRLAIGLGDELAVDTPIAEVAVERLAAAFGLDAPPA